jgi:hypothetical protein
MEKIFKLLSLMTFLVLAIGLVSACENNCPGETTQIKGVIYQNGNLTDTVAKATVTVTCTHAYTCNGKIKYQDYTKKVKSNEDGSYLVTFYPTKCDQNDLVVVTATKNDLMGSEDGKVDILTYSDTAKKCLNKNVGIVNVPLVPEFGVFASALTLLSAVGIFFVVRKKGDFNSFKK